MPKRNKEFQLDIFGNEIPLGHIRLEEQCAKRWNNKIKKHKAKYFDIKKESGFYVVSETKCK